MSGYPTPLEQQYGETLSKMQRRVAVLESQIAHLASAGSVASSVLTSSQPSIPLAVPAGTAFNTLRVAWTGRSDVAGTATYMCVQLNGDTASHYLWQINQANNASTAGSGGSGATATQIQIGTMAGGTATAGYVGGGEFVIPNASGATFKVPSGYSSSFNSTTNSYSGAYGGLWLSTAAVTSITLFAASGNLVAGSAAYLYGET